MEREKQMRELLKRHSFEVMPKTIEADGKQHEPLFFEGERECFVFAR